MKFVISNYASANQTESYYFNASINLLENHKSVLWDQRSISLYDIFDQFNPDVFICHGKAVPSDIISYCKENGGPKLAINVTGLTQKETNNIEQFLIDNNVEIHFLFTNTHEKVTNTKTRTINIPFGADVFLSTKKQISYSIDKCYIVSNESDIIDYEGTYHYITNDESLSSKTDAFLPVMSIASLYDNYKEIIIKNNSSTLPQVFFDAVYYGNDVKLVSSKYTDLVLNKLLKLEDGESLKEKIKTKHTCLNRTKTLLSQFPDQEGLNKFDQLIEEYRKVKNK
jgi:hypothetical protein